MFPPVFFQLIKIWRNRKLLLAYGDSRIETENSIFELAVLRVILDLCEVAAELTRRTKSSFYRRGASILQSGETYGLDDFDDIGPGAVERTTNSDSKFSSGTKLHEGKNSPDVVLLLKG